MYSVVLHDDDEAYDSDNHRKPWHSASDIASLRAKQSNAETLFSSASSASSTALKVPARLGLSRFVEHLDIDDKDEVLAPLPHTLPSISSSPPPQPQQQQRRTRPRAHTEFVPSTDPQHQQPQSAHPRLQSHIRLFFRAGTSAQILPGPARRRLTKKTRPQTPRPAVSSAHDTITVEAPIPRLRPLPVSHRPQSIVGRLFAHAD